MPQIGFSAGRRQTRSTRTPVPRGRPPPQRPKLGQVNQSGDTRDQSSRGWGGEVRCSHLLYHGLLGEHPLRRMALSAEVLHKRHPSPAGELPHQVHSVPVVPHLSAEALHLLQVALLLPGQLCRAREGGEQRRPRAPAARLSRTRSQAKGRRPCL